MKKKLIWSALLVGSLFLTACGEQAQNTEEAAAPAQPALVQTTFGAIEGNVDSEQGVLNWKGVPYAAAPVGDLRWKAPQDPAAWEAVLETKVYKEICTQQKGVEGYWKTTTDFVGGEDCLFLNIWRPDTDEKNLPVFYFIHGGGNMVGSNHSDFSALAKRMNVVAVGVAYRLGPLGFLAHPVLNGGSGAESVANYGLLDQIKGLEWVQDNIAAFGGNPANVTIGGESAGAGDVLALLTSPMAKGLFHKAIPESLGEGMEPRAAALERSARMVAVLNEKAGADLDGEALKQLMYDTSAYDILEAFNGGVKDGRVFDMNHIIDDVVLTGSYPSVIKSGNYNKVPVMIGYNEREMGSLLQVLPPLSPGDPDFRKSIQYAQGNISFDELFANETEQEIYEAAQKHSSDMYGAMVNEIATVLADQQKEVYAYRFAFGEREGVIPEAAHYVLGAGHAMELPFVFGGDFCTFGVTYTPENKQGRKALQNAMMTYWGQFMHTGNPTAKGLPEWQPWVNGDGPKSIILDATKSETVINMVDDALTMEGVRAAINGLPANVKPNVSYLVESYYPGMWLYDY